MKPGPMNLLNLDRTFPTRRAAPASPFSPGLELEMLLAWLRICCVVARADVLEGGGMVLFDPARSRDCLWLGSCPIEDSSPFPSVSGIPMRSLCDLELAIPLRSCRVVM